MVSAGSKVVNTGLFFFCGLALFFICGCGESSPDSDEEWMREASIRFCNELLRNPKLSERARSLAEQVLRKRENNRLDSEPVLIDALLMQAEKSGTVYLAVALSDEDDGVAGIGIEERHLDSGEDPVIIKERYPILGGELLRIACFIPMPVTIRKKGQRKNEEDWKKYVDAGDVEGNLMPEVLVSIPQVGKVNAKIWIYDHSGHESEPLSLENYLVSARADD